MSRSVSFALLIGVGFLVLSLTLAQPTYLSDANSFLKDFVGSNLLNVLGVILAITAASSAQLHLEFNKAEERRGKRGFKSSRSALRGAIATLIGLFIAAVTNIVTKSIVAKTDTGQSAFNGVALLILLANVIILIDISQAAFSIKAHLDEPEPTSPPNVEPQAQERPNTLEGR